MAFMKRDVNLGLLFLIVAALLMFSGFTVYYQTTFKNISGNYDQKLKELEMVTKELDSKRGQLNDTSVQLQLRKQQEVSLSEKFTDVRTEKEQLETDKAKLQTELISTSGQLASAKTELESAKTNLAAKEQQIASLSKQIVNLKDDIEDLENDLAECENG